MIKTLKNIASLNFLRWIFLLLLFRRARDSMTHTRGNTKLLRGLRVQATLNWCKPDALSIEPSRRGQIVDVKRKIRLGFQTKKMNSDGGQETKRNQPLNEKKEVHRDFFDFSSRFFKPRVKTRWFGREGEGGGLLKSRKTKS